MKCYKCGENLTNNDICANCGSDVSAYKIIVKASNSYYNEGLMKAQVRDLSGAVYCLRMSLSVNKYNTRARNLLGLVYYEMGEVVAALSEWVISKNYKPEKNAADVFIKKVQSNQNKLEAMNQTIKKFNRCLEYAKEGSEDVAKIQLKKVISTNPNFIKAYLLYSLLLMKKGEFEKAKRYLGKALAIDKSNTLAQRYLIEANERIAERKKLPDNDYTKPIVKKDKEIDRKALTGHDVIIPKGSYREPTNGAVTVVNLLIGVAIGAALIWFLILPTKLKGVTSDNKKLINEYIEQLSDANTSVAKLEAEIESLKKDNTQLESVSGGIADKVEKYQKVLDAYYYNQAGDSVAAAECLADMEVADLPSDGSKALYTQIWGQVFMQAYDSLIAQGDNLRKSGEKEGAADAYAKAYSINPTDIAAYNAGLNYQEAGDNTSAKTYFNNVINNHPGSRYVKDSQARLDAMN